MEVFPEYFPEYSLRFQFLRPSLRDELSDVMRRCRDRQPQPLHDCDGGIEVSIEEIPLYDSRYSPHLVEKSDRLLLPGQMHGAAFFYQKFVRRAAPFIEMKNKRGEILYGYCSWPGDYSVVGNLGYTLFSPSYALADGLITGGYSANA